jgi:hypothetical protein
MARQKHNIMEEKREKPSSAGQELHLVGKLAQESQGVAAIFAQLTFHCLG